MRRQDDTVDTLALSEILATRLCHDLSSHANVIAGAIEEIQDSHPPDPDALSLASEASAALVNRLRLARAAWGASASSMSVAEFRRLANSIPRRGVRMDIDGVHASADFSPSAARLAINVLMLATECLPAGGSVEVHGHPQQDVIVRIAGPRAAWPTGLAGMIADPAAALEGLRLRDHVAAARLMQAPLTALIAHVTGQRIRMLLGPSPEPAPPLLLGLTPLH